MNVVFVLIGAVAAFFIGAVAGMVHQDAKHSAISTQKMKGRDITNCEYHNFLYYDGSEQ